jgi:hypothetical protein
VNTLYDHDRDNKIVSKNRDMITTAMIVSIPCSRSEEEKVGSPEMFSKCPLYLYHGPAAEI